MKCGYIFEKIQIYLNFCYFFDMMVSPRSGKGQAVVGMRKSGQNPLFLSHEKMRLKS